MNKLQASNTKLQGNSKPKASSAAMKEWSNGVMEWASQKAPSFNHQASGKLQAPRFRCGRACGLWLVDSLVLGVWCLEFLAFFFMKQTALVSEQPEVRTKPREC